MAQTDQTEDAESGDSYVEIARNVAIGVKDITEDEINVVTNHDGVGLYTEELTRHLEELKFALDTTDDGEPVTVSRLAAAGFLDLMQDERDAVERNDEVGSYDELDETIEALDEALGGTKTGLDADWVDAEDLHGTPAAPATGRAVAYCDACLRTILENGDTARVIVKQRPNGQVVISGTYCTDHDLQQDDASGIVADAQLTTAAFNPNQLVLTRVRSPGEPAPRL